MANVQININKANKINSEYSLFISFSYNQEIVDVMRSFPQKFYHAGDKAWELPFNKLGTVVEKLENHEIEITGQYVHIEKEKVVVPKDFTFKTKPFNHQTEGFEFGLKYDKWLLADEQGLGKTKQVIDIAVAKKLAKGYKHCLIICGVNGLKWNWRNEVSIHSDESAYILGQKVKGTKLTIGSNSDRLKDLENIENIKDYFLITNIETLRNEDIAKKMQELCNTGEIGMIAFDECHKAKNPTSQQGKAILKIHAQTQIAMTGTPLMNNPMDLYIILKWLGYENHSFYAFKNHYCVMGGYNNYQIVGYKNLDQLQEAVNDIMLRRLKKDVLDLPEKTYVDEYVEMSSKQKKIYDEVTAEIKENIDNIKMANNPLAELIRMRQATGYTGILSSTIKESAKLDRMEELVEEAVENGKKVVIFSNWTQITDEVYARLHPKYHPAIITGETPDDTRQDEVYHFQNDDNCKVIIGTIGAMGTGLNLYAGSIIIFLDQPWTKAAYDQAVDRCHRIGQKNNLTIYNLICKNTIDERISEIIKKKGELSDALIDGKVEMNNSQLLSYLLS